jgi:hypothetical protein
MRALFGFMLGKIGPSNIIIDQRNVAPGLTRVLQQWSE